MPNYLLFQLLYISWKFENSKKHGVGVKSRFCVNWLNRNISTRRECLNILYISASSWYIFCAKRRYFESLFRLSISMRFKFDYFFTNLWYIGLREHPISSIEANLIKLYTFLEIPTSKIYFHGNKFRLNPYWWWKYTDNTENWKLWDFGKMVCLFECYTFF